VVLRPPLQGAEGAAEEQERLIDRRDAQVVDERESGAGAVGVGTAGVISVERRLFTERDAAEVHCQPAVAEEGLVRAARLAGTGGLRDKDQ
jgi:hypothetical protein